MSGLNIFKKGKDFLLNLVSTEEEYYEEEIEPSLENTSSQIKQEQTVVSKPKQTITRRVKVANGPDIIYTEATDAPAEPKSYFTKTKIQSPKVTNEIKPPVLRVMTQKEFKICTFNLTSYDKVTRAVDALKSGKCIILNFEKLDFTEQYRICDFLNGACYVLDGSVMRITSTMVIYAPKGIALKQAK